MDQYQIIEKIISYVAENMDKDLCLETLSKELYYSKYDISRVFLKNTGYTIYQYIKQQRLDRAAKELIETESPIVEIAYHAHYQSQQAFTFAFHQVFQVTPQEYRKNGVKNLCINRIKLSLLFSLCAFGQTTRWGQMQKGRAAA